MTDLDLDALRRLCESKLGSGAACIYANEGLALLDRIATVAKERDALRKFAEHSPQPSSFKREWIWSDICVCDNCLGVRRALAAGEEPQHGKGKP